MFRRTFKINYQTDQTEIIVADHLAVTDSWPLPFLLVPYITCCAFVLMHVVFKFGKCRMCVVPNACGNSFPVPQRTAIAAAAHPTNASTGSSQRLACPHERAKPLLAVCLYGPPEDRHKLDVLVDLNLELIVAAAL